MSYGPALMTLSLIALIFTIPPLAWNIKCSNIPAISLISWLFLMNLNTFISAAIWSGKNYSSTYSGRGYCDIISKLQVGVNVGICSCVGAIALDLYLILNAKSSLLLNTKKRRIIEACMCWITPIVIMAIIYVVQDARFLVFRYSGCQYSLAPNWVSVLILSIPMVLWSLTSFVLALMTIIKFFQIRKDVKDILHCTNSGLNLTRFARLLLFCFLVVCVMCPLSLYFLVIAMNSIDGGFDFSDIHDSLLWGIILFKDSGSPKYDRWLHITLAYLTFIIFGLGEDSVKLYQRVARRITGERLYNGLAESIARLKSSVRNTVVKCKTQNPNHKTVNTTFHRDHQTLSQDMSLLKDNLLYGTKTLGESSPHRGTVGHCTKDELYNAIHPNDETAYDDGDYEMVYHLKYLSTTSNETPSYDTRKQGPNPMISLKALS